MGVLILKFQHDLGLLLQCASLAYVFSVTSYAKKHSDLIDPILAKFGLNSHHLVRIIHIWLVLSLMRINR